MNRALEEGLRGRRWARSKPGKTSAADDDLATRLAQSDTPGIPTGRTQRSHAQSQIRAGRNRSGRARWERRSSRPSRLGDAQVGSACGGVCACSTCHVYVKQGLDALAPRFRSRRGHHGQGVRRARHLAAGLPVQDRRDVTSSARSAARAARRSWMNTPSCAQRRRSDRPRVRVPGDDRF